MTHAGHKIGVTLVAVGCASGASLLACRLCLPRDRGARWSELAELWGHRYRAFVAGLLLSTALLEVLPLTAEAYRHLYAQAGVVVSYPLSQVGVCLGFLLAWAGHMLARGRWWRAADHRRCCCWAGEEVRPAVHERVRAADMELQERRSRAAPVAVVAELSSSEEDVLYDSGEAWAPLTPNGGPSGVHGDGNDVPDDLDNDDDDDEDDPDRDSAVARLLSDPTVDAARAEAALQEEEEAAQTDFCQAFAHVALTFSVVAALSRPISIWLLGLSATGYVTLATHQLCAVLIARFNLPLLCAFSFFGATVTAASGMSLGFFLIAELQLLPWHVAGCLVWGLAGGCQLFAACMQTSWAIRCRLSPLQVVACMALATLVAVFIKAFDG